MPKKKKPPISGNVLPIGMLPKGWIIDGLSYSVGDRAWHCRLVYWRTEEDVQEWGRTPRAAMLAALTALLSYLKKQLRHAKDNLH